jgi:ParB family chromosome partitioning protein
MAEKGGLAMQLRRRRGILENDRIQYIPVGRIYPNPNQPRRQFDRRELAELADSIREHGILQPLTVRRCDKGFELVSGERRLRAARLAGLGEVPCLIAGVDEETSSLLALVENLQRRDLDFIEEARAIARSLKTLASPRNRRRPGWANPSPPWPISCGCCAFRRRRSRRCSRTA